MLAKIATGLAGMGAGAAAYLGYNNYMKTQHEASEEANTVQSSNVTNSSKGSSSSPVPPGYCGPLLRPSLTGIPSKSKKWDSDWDRREPAPLLAKNDVLVDDVKVPTKSRHIYLIRHGEYHEESKNDFERKLTEKGRKQATFVGKRLNELDLKFDKFIISSMTRAKETAEQILKELPKEKVEKTITTDFLREGSPAVNEPKAGRFHPPSAFFQDGARIEAAFRKYFHRAEPNQDTPERVVLVCHANVIRYFLCRALQIPEEAWLRFSIKHGSLTHIEIKPSGRVLARAVGETNFMPDELIKF